MTVANVGAQRAGHRVELQHELLLRRLRIEQQWRRRELDRSQCDDGSITQCRGGHQFHWCVSHSWFERAISGQFCFAGVDILGQSRTDADQSDSQYRDGQHRAYSEITFNYTSAVPHAAGIRLYSNSPVADCLPTRPWRLARTIWLFRIGSAYPPIQPFKFRRYILALYFQTYELSDDNLLAVFQHEPRCVHHLGGDQLHDFHHY